ncbi:MAG: DegT/DnrJ/EryC1/StrS family aminotransferase [Sedimentisphaerales bacterium]
MRIYLSRPDITEKEIQAVTDVLRSPDLSLGPKLPEFERDFAKYIGVKRAVAVNSGTSALYLCLLSLGIGPGDPLRPRSEASEVITTPFTFIATSNVVIMTGAKPVFVDIDPVSMNIDANLIERKITKKTKAIMPVEVFGNPAGFDKICKIADKHNLLVLEDSCEALGSSLNGQKAGTFGKMSTFAFYPNKQITTGEGGMVLTDDDDLADMCVSLRNQGRGKTGGWLSHERLGYNYRLSDINCVLGLVQLSRIEEISRKRKQVAKWYQENLAGDDRFVVPTEPAGCDINWFVFVIRLTERFTRQNREKVLQTMRDAGIQVSNYFTPVHLQQFMVEKFGFKPGDFPVTESIADRTIALPYYNNLTKAEIAIVCDELRKAVGQL